MKKDTLILAKRYAGALFDLAVEHNAVAAIRGDLQALAQIAKSDAAVDRFLSTPMVPRDMLGQVITTLKKKVKLHALTEKFLDVLSQNKRLFILTSVGMAFDDLYHAQQGETKARIISAHQLSEKQIKAIEQKLGKEMNTKILADAQTNEELIGGLVVQIGSTMIDDSLKTKLNNIEQVMKGVA